MYSNYQEGIYENAISEAYYTMYNTLTSLFYKCGIKCENHSASAILLKEVFGLDKLYKEFNGNIMKIVNRISR